MTAELPSSNGSKRTKSKRREESLGPLVGGKDKNLLNYPHPDKTRKMEKEEMQQRFLDDDALGFYTRTET